MFTERQLDDAYNILIHHNSIESKNQMKIARDFLETIVSTAKKEFKRLNPDGLPTLSDQAIISTVEQKVKYAVAKAALDMPHLRETFLDVKVEFIIFNYPAGGKELFTYVSLKDKINDLYHGQSEIKTLFLTREEIEEKWISIYGNKVPQFDFRYDVNK